MTTEGLFDLQGKKALVTGGAMGIGFGYATALAEAGADVAIVDVNQAMAERAVEHIRQLGRDAVFISCDVSDQAQIEAMMEQVVQRFGRLDIAVNNAGIIGSQAPDLEQDKNNWDKIIAINLSGVWLCAQAQARQMKQQLPMGGKIINTASGAASLVFADGAYSASKAGVVHLTHTLANQWGRCNINVNCISPGSTLSPLLAHLPLSVRQTMRDKIPLGHLQRPSDTKGAIVFLASTASDYITGVNLPVDGGLVLSKEDNGAERDTPPRVSPAEEIQELKTELTALGIDHDEQGVRY